MSRLLIDFLSRNKITITELIHRADMLEKLEATGTVYQHAIQKVAVAQAANTTTAGAADRQEPERAHHPGFQPRLSRPAQGPVSRSGSRTSSPNWRSNAIGQGDAAYIFNGALARHLKDATGWDEKVLMLITIMESAPTEEGAAQAGAVVGGCDPGGNPGRFGGAA